MEVKMRERNGERVGREGRLLNDYLLRFIFMLEVVCFFRIC